MDTEEHVCQSCGDPLDPDSEKGEFCSFCITYPNREEVVKKVSEKIHCETGRPAEECAEQAEKQIGSLSRWQA